MYTRACIALKLATIVIFVTVAAFLLCAPVAWAAAEEAPPDPLRLEVGGTPVVLSWKAIRSAGVSSEPRSIQVGVDCGMEDMCGIDPCLCGSAVDQWGACACNGLKAVSPAMTFTSDDGGVVRALDIGGKSLLIPTGTGTAMVTVHGSLPHHTEAVTSFEVTVRWPALVIMGVIGVVCLAVVAGIFLGARRIWRSVRRRIGRDRLPVASEEGLES